MRYIAFLALLALVACSPEPTRTVTPGWYLWQTQYSPTSEELKALSGTIPYVRLFDIVPTDTFAKPIARLRTLKIEQKAIIPVVFIEHRSFRRAHPDSLARRVFGLIQEMCAERKLSYRQLQMDCDWTKTSKASYFRFLHTMKRLCQCELSATIRLHQLKFRAETGVPPVDRGMLMCYNMGQVDQAAESNSIYRLDLLDSYTNTLESYPLALDVALPIWQWGAQFRSSRLKALHPNLPPLPDTLFKKVNKNTYRLEKSGYFAKQYWYKGDRLRLESASAEDLEAGAELIGQRLRTDSLALVYYYLNSTNLNRYENLEAIRRTLSVQPLPETTAGK